MVELRKSSLSINEIPAGHGGKIPLIVTMKKQSVMSKIKKVIMMALLTHAFSG